MTGELLSYPDGLICYTDGSKKDKETRCENLWDGAKMWDQCPPWEHIHGLSILKFTYGGHYVRNLVFIYTGSQRVLKVNKLMLN